MYEKLVDDFFIRVENLKNDYVNKYTFISDQTLQIFKDDIKLLLREIFGCNILNYIDVELKRDDYIHSTYFVNFIDKRRYDIIVSKEGFISVIKEVMQLCIKSK